MKYAELIDAYRIIPRLMVAGYGYLVYDVSMWFMSLSAPTGTQSAFVSTVIGAAAVWFGFYTNTGKKW